MATKLTQIAKKSCGRILSQSNSFRNPVNSTIQKRCVTQNTMSLNGAIPPEPLKKRFSIPKVMLCMGAGTFVGQYTAKSFAAFLEETEMFVPDDDDD